tara:strand:- start:489 stop:1124 length:636 start_codon:yes stop_codon:yes gene_type:complete
MMAFPSMATFTGVTYSHEFQGNDCSGYFGSGFNSCEIFYNDPANQLDFDASVLGKYDSDSSSWESDGDSLSISMSGNQNGSWGKLANAIDFPDIRFWVAKGGNAFMLFWTVDPATVGSNCDTVYSLACLNEAKIVTHGSWTTPINPNNKHNKGFGLSHLTFFGGTTADTPCTNCPVIVPEPQTMMLFAFAIVALATRQKRLTLFKAKKTKH